MHPRTCPAPAAPSMAFKRREHESERPQVRADRSPHVLGRLDRCGLYLPGPWRRRNNQFGRTDGAAPTRQRYANRYWFGGRSSAALALLAAARVRRGDHVLNVGCGTGYFARLLAEAVGQGRTNEAIAELLVLSLKTVRNNVANI